MMILTGILITIMLIVFYKNQIKEISRVLVKESFDPFDSHPDYLIDKDCNKAK